LLAFNAPYTKNEAFIAYALTVATDMVLDLSGCAQFDATRFAEHRRNATRHCHPAVVVKSKVPSVIRAWLFNSGRNAAPVAEMLNIVFHPSTTAD